MSGDLHPEGLAKEETIFHAALQFGDPAKRSAYLDLACDGDPALRGRMEKLLALEPGAEDVLKPPVAEIAAPLGAFPAGAPGKDAQLEVPEGRIGRYKLLEKIGEGGMGVVYMAEQCEPVRRKVALKIIKLGLDTRQVVARFEAERQALALMDHPNIAKVLDAGTTELGRPYFVMDLVRGLPITEFCDQAGSSPRERLDLFLDVCSAVGHAHQKGIIHRDIKPSNILVTLNGDKAVAKIIDFGIAKAIQQQLTDKTLFTQFQQFLGTPAYTSPEQASLSSLDVDTRSDIYGLGVLLYELLTGKTPFDSRELVAAGLEGMRKTILEREPAPPSRKLSTLNGEDLTRIARMRRAAPPRLIHVIQGDLDWIVMKCLEKDRARRYDSAGGLAADIRRYLANESVLARPQTLAYRMRKWIQRHTAQFAMISVAVAALVVAAAVSTWQAVRASRAQRVSQQQAETANAVKSFLVQQLLGKTVYWKQTEKSFDPKDRILIERIAREAEGKFTNQPLVEAEVREALADSFSTLDDYTNGLKQVESVVTLRRAHQGMAHPDTLRALSKLGNGLYGLGRHREADEVLDETIAIARRASKMLTEGAGEALFARGWRLTYEGLPQAGRPYLKEALEIFGQIYGESDPRTGTKWYMMAVVTQDLGQFKEAEDLFQSGIRQYTLSLGTNDWIVGIFHKGYGLLLTRLGRFPEAISNFETALEIQRRSVGPDNQHTLEVETFLSDALALQGGTNEAIRRNIELRRRWAQHLPLDHPRRMIRNLGGFFVRHREFDEAKAAFADVRQALIDVPPQRPDEFETLLRATAVVDGWAVAAEVCESNFDQFPDSLSTWLRKAWVYRYVGKEEKYREVVNRVLLLSVSTANTNEQHIPIEIAGLGPAELLPAQKADIEERIEALNAALPARAEDLRRRGYRAIGQFHLRTGEFQRALKSLEQAASSQTAPDAYPLYLKAACLKRLNRGEEAIAALREADSLIAAQFPSEPEFDRFLEPGQLYQWRVMRREAQAEIDGR